MASSNDLIKYFTEEVVRYLDTPKQNRQRKIKEPITYHWFGFIPFSLKMFLRQLILQIKKALRLIMVGFRYLGMKLRQAYVNRKK